MSLINPLERMKRLFAGDAGDVPLSDIAIGDRYEQLKNDMPVWVIERISNVRSSEYPLIGMRSEQHPDLQKVISLAALIDGEDYRPAA